MNLGRYSYDDINFSDRDTLKILIDFRAEFKTTGYMSSFSGLSNHKTYSTMNVNIMSIYDYLEELISDTELTQKNITLLRLVMSGYSVNYIYRNFENYNKEGTIKMYNRILEKIAETNTRRCQ